MSELHERSARVAIVCKDTHEVAMTLNKGKSRSRKMVGGGIEAGETSRQAAAREIEQETKGRSGIVNSEELRALPSQVDEKSNAEWFCWVVSNELFEQIIGDGDGGDDVEKIYRVPLDEVKSELSYPLWQEWWWMKDSPHGGLAAINEILSSLE